MPQALERLRSAAEEFDEDVEPKELRQVIDCLEQKFCQLVHRARVQADHIAHGYGSTAGWVAITCGMTPASVGDRLCVGEQLEAMPEVAQALSSGELSYQSTAVICHLRKSLGDKTEYLEEADWIGKAKGRSIQDLRALADEARYLWDPDGFDRLIEEDYEQRFLYVSEMRGMYHLTGVLDREAGATVKTAIDSLTKRLGSDDVRTNKQRRADALVEIVHHAMDKGTLPRRNGVRPHVTVTTTLEGLKGELGAPASQLEAGMPISSKTVQRLACDGTLCRVLKADSVVVDVGRATRAVSPAQRRGVKARYKTCCGVGCDRPISMTSTHHIEFWGRGGLSNLPNFVPLCYYHHRLVHESAWQVIKAGEGIRFIPPDREIVRRARGPGRYWAA